MSTYVNENFDGVTPPALPTNWSSFSGTVATSNAASHSGSQSLNLSNTGNWTYAWNSTQDQNNGATQASAWFKMSGTPSTFVDPSIFLRAAAPASNSVRPNGYQFTVGMYSGDGGILFTYNSGGTSTNFNTFKPANYGTLWDATHWYKLVYRVEDIPENGGQTLHSGGVQRDDGYWLTSAGTWVNTGVPTYCVSATHNPTTFYGGGLALFGSYCSSGTSVYVDDVLFQDATLGPACTALPAWVPGNSLELSGTAISSDAGQTSHGPANAFDGNYSTSWYSTSKIDAYIGTDLGAGNSAILTRVLVSPRTDAGADIYLVWPLAYIEGSNNNATWTTLGTVSKDHCLPFNMLPIPITPGSAYRYFRVRHPAYYSIAAEIRFEGQVSTGTPSTKPVRPTIQTASGAQAGKFANGTTVTITTPTSGATIYYTTDGSTPTTSSTAYSGAITLPSNAVTTVKAIAHLASATTADSDVTTGVFRCPHAFVPDTGATAYGTTNDWPEDVYDDTGILIEAHTGGIIYDAASGKYYLYGGDFNSATGATIASDVNPRGVHCYSSTDLYNWHREGIVAWIAPGAYRDGSGNWMWSQTRPHVLVNPSPTDPTRKYVLWTHLDNTSYGDGYAGCAASSSPTGPFRWVFFGQPSATIARDCNLFVDNDGTAYFVADSGAHTNVTAFKLDSTTDNTSFTATSITLDSTGNREGVALFRQGSYYYLITSALTSYGGGNSREQYKAATTLAGLNAAAYASIYGSAPTSGTVAYNAQSTSLVRVQGRQGWMYMADIVDAGESPMNLYHCRMAWWPLADSAFGTGTFSLTAPNSWDLSSLPSATGISASPSTVAQGTTTSVTVAGTGTNFTTLGQFSLSGGTGASIASGTINSTTSATLVINGGTALGTNNLTLTDTGTGASTTLSVADETAPSVPTGLSASSVTGTSLTLSWAASTDNVTAQGSLIYLVYRNGTLVNTTAAGATSFNDSGLTGGTTYAYNVKAEDGAGNISAASSTLNVTTSATSYTASASPTTVAPGGSSTITVSPNGPYVGTITPTCASGSFSPASLSFNGEVSKTLTYTANTANGAKSITWSSSPALSDPGATTVTVSDSTAPSVPTLTATASKGQVALSWTSSTDPDDAVTSYKIYRGGTLFQTISAPTTSYTDTGLTNGTTYTYTVSAVDSNGDESAQSVGQSATPTDSTAPSAPTGLGYSSLTATSLTLSWTASSDADDAAGTLTYVVYRNGSQVGTTAAGVVTYNDSGLSAATTYAYTVKAKDPFGNLSAASAALNVTTPTAPATSYAVSPSSVTLSKSGTQVLTFTPNGTSSATVTPTITGGGSLSPATITFDGTSAAKTATYTAPNAPASVTISYSNNGSLTDSASTSITVQDLTTPSVPTGLSASSVTQTSLTLSWSASTDPDDATITYKVYRDASLIATTTSTTANDSGLAVHSTHSYTVTAQDAAGNVSAASQALSVTTLNYTLRASPGTILPGSTNNTITLTGGATSWTAGSPGTPTFGVAKASTNDVVKNSQTVASATSATLSLNAGATVGIITITDPSTGVSTTISVARASAALNQGSHFVGGGASKSETPGVNRDLSGQGVSSLSKGVFAPP